MATSAPLTAQPLRPEGSFNWIFLIEYIVNGILCLFFLFYFNRLFATFLSYAIRLYTWHTLRVYLDIEALQISLLAGRIFFKGVRYHGDNETIYVHGGYITWRYWLRSVKECQYYSPQRPQTRPPPGAKTFNKEGTGARDGNNESRPSKSFPSRISVHVSGVEAFLYNRSPAYDAIVQAVEEDGSSKSAARSQARDARASEKAGYRSLESKSLAMSSNSSLDIKDEGSGIGIDSQSSAGEEFNLPPGAPAPTAPAFLRMLPIQVQCHKGAAVLGNENTPSVITAKFDEADGNFDASRSGPLDVFKILMGFDVSGIFIQMKPNMDHKRPQLAEAEILKENQQQSSVHTEGDSDSDRPECNDPPKPRKTRLSEKRPKWLRYPGLSVRSRTSLDSIAAFPGKVFTSEQIPNATFEVPGQTEWLGLSRYLDEKQQDEHTEWDSMQYAKTSILADIPSLHFKFYWDIAGKRPYSSCANKHSRPKQACEINGNAPPEYGMEIVVRGGRVNYGPWADRHRINLQQLFFPVLFSDAQPTPQLQPGDTRLCTVFNIVVQIEDAVVLRVPFREPSKDWKWKGRAVNLSYEGVHGRKHHSEKSNAARKRSARQRKHNNPAAGTDLRPFAWFDIKVQADSTVRYTMDMFSRAKGYDNKLKVDASALEIFSSLNHALLWRSGKIVMSCDLSNPLSWNALREWIFEIDIHDLDFFLLRDHTFLLVDLIADWSAGPPLEFFTFVPYRYLMKANFHNFKLWLNVNDANIVNNSDDKNENDFVILYGRTLLADLVIPLDRFRPSENEISFDVNGHELGFELHLPAKNTQHTLLDDKNVAQLRCIDLKGAYSYCNDIKTGLTDTLNLDIIGKGFSIAFHGFFGRQLVKIKENYFGEDIHFRTLEEYQEIANNNFEGAKTSQVSMNSNDLDVILDITAEDARIVVPAGVYSAHENIELICDMTNVDLRVSNHYLELMVNSSPLSMTNTSSSQGDLFDAPVKSPRQIYLDGVKVYGHRFFGLAPSEPPYISNWDIDAGDIIGECSHGFLKTAIGAAQAAALTIGDEENALSIPQLIFLHDATFVRFKSSLVQLSLDIGDDVLTCGISDVHGSFNDCSGDFFSQRLKMTVPNLFVSVTKSGDILAHLTTSLEVDMTTRVPNFAHEKELQRTYITHHDQRSSRAPFLLSAQATDVARWSNAAHNRAEMSIPLPALPIPLTSASTMGPNMSPCSQENLLTNSLRLIDDALEPASLNAGIQRAAQSSDSTVDEESLQSANSLHEHQKAFGAKADLPVDVSHASGPADSRRVNIKQCSSNVFERPDVALDPASLDLRELPRLVSDSKHYPRPGLKSRSAGEIFNKDLDSDSSHTSLILQARPGVTALCKPDAIRAIANLAGRISPTSPVQVLDQYHFDTIMEVLSSISRRNGKNSILDFSFSVERFHARFVNELSLRSEVRAKERDIYNFIVQNMSCTARIKSMPESKHQEDLKAVHCVINSVVVSAQQDLGQVANEGVAFEATIDDVLMWLAQGDRLSVHLSYNMLETVLSSDKVDFLAALLHRTTLMVDEFRSRFSSISEQNQIRRRYVVYMLTKLGEDIADPSFLTRPTYVLRSTETHLRNSDSWKITLRLQHVLSSLPDFEKRALHRSCAAGSAEYPQGVESYVLESLDQWRSWDALHVKDSIAMRILYGSMSGVEKLHDRSNIPVHATLRSSGLRMVVDPGGRESEIAFGGLSVAITMTPPPPPSALQFFHDVKENRITTVQINTFDVMLRLNWDICELVDQVLTLFGNEWPDHGGQSRLAHAQTATESSTGQQVHFIYNSESAQIDVATPSFLQTFSAYKLNLSTTASGMVGDSEDVVMNAMLLADRMSMQTHMGERFLGMSKLEQPCLWLAFERVSRPAGIVDSFKSSGMCMEVELNTEEDISGMLAAVHAGLVNEARYLSNLIQKHSRTFQSKTTVRSPDRTTSFVIDSALLLGRYNVNLALLHNLQYSTSGQEIRLSVSPKPVTGSLYRLDFDLKAQSHHFRQRLSPKAPSVSTFHLPAINGAVDVFIRPDVVKASAAASIERIVVDGASIYGLACALSSSATVNAAETIKADSATLMDSFHESFPSHEHSRSSTEVKAMKVLLDLNLTMVGFTVSVEAPGRTSDLTSTELIFNIGPSRFSIANTADSERITLPFPNMHLTMGQMEADVLSSGPEHSHTRGKAILAAQLICKVDEVGPNRFSRTFNLVAFGPDIEVSEDTPPRIVQLLAHCQDRMKEVDVMAGKRIMKRLQRFSMAPAKRPLGQHKPTLLPERNIGDETTFYTRVNFHMRQSRVSLKVEKSLKPTASKHSEKGHDLIFSVKEISLLTQSEAEARLQIEDVRLQLGPRALLQSQRALNSAHMPDILFTARQLKSDDERRIFCQAAGKVLDVQVEPELAVPASDLTQSINRCIQMTQTQLARLPVQVATTGPHKKATFGQRRTAVVSVDASFEGALIRVQNRRREESRKVALPSLKTANDSDGGRFGQFFGEGPTTSFTLHAPGIATKVTYDDCSQKDASLSIELRVDGSNNTLSPSVVPLVLQITDNIKEALKNAEPMAANPNSQEKAPPSKIVGEEALARVDPRELLGKTKLNFGFRICKQEITMACQPIAKISANMSIEDIYITINNVDSSDNDRFFAISAAFTGLNLSLRHAYSRDATFSFTMESIVMSLMNSKHISGSSGIFAILKINPTKAQLNAKQLQDILLFREIWLPPEVRHPSTAQARASSLDPQDYFMHRYQQVAAAASFPWNATFIIADLSLDLDLGQGIGRLFSRVSNFWASSKKGTSSQQTLCVGIDKLSVQSTGRMSGFVEMDGVKVRTSIAWPSSDPNAIQTPLIQGSLGFSELEVKAAFDYQAFAVAHVTSFEFLMYNVQDRKRFGGDRLVAILDGDKVHAYGTAMSAALGVSLAQAFERLIQEKKASYDESIKEIERFLRRKSTLNSVQETAPVPNEPQIKASELLKMPISLHTDVVVALEGIDVGFFPRTFMDHQVLKLEASNMQARFDVSLENRKVHSGLGLTLGQVRAALSGIPHSSVPKTLGEVAVEEIVKNATAARGGIILRVPKVVAAMQTWQAAESNLIDFIFRSTFEGKIDVGWNYSRISFIRGMWATHSRTFAARLGKPLPESALKITGPDTPSDIRADSIKGDTPEEKQKITAVVNLPQSKYTYNALEPPVIDTPHLRDLGEATPPLEWIGLHRDRLPNITHQIVIVTLLEVAKEVEDAYSKILGSA